MTKSEDWATEQARRIGATVLKLRGERSGQWLSDETFNAGHRVSRTSISELENGKRKSVSTAELIVLAVALRVSPVRLIYPDMPDGLVDVLPGKPVPSIEAAMFFSGELSYGLIGDEVQQFRTALEGARLVERSRDRVKLESNISFLSSVVARTKDQSARQSLIDQIVLAQSQINAINEELKQIDGAVVGDVG
jgi:hypothetical protein